LALTRFDPSYWLVDYNSPMVATAIAQTGAPGQSDTFFVACLFRTAGDLAAIKWYSLDGSSHPLYRYETNIDYSGASWAFDFVIQGSLIPIDQLNGLTLTVTTTDNATHEVRLWNYLSSGNATAGRITLNFPSVLAGFTPTTPIDWAHVQLLQINLVPVGYVARSAAPIAEVQASLTISNMAVTGPSLAQDLSPRPAHTLRMTDDLDDSGYLVPRRIARQVALLGYRTWYNFYVGTGHFHQISWSSGDGRFIVDPSKPVVCWPVQVWFANFLAELAANGFSSFIVAISFEILASLIPTAWQQYDAGGNPAHSGYTPPSAFITPSNPDPLNYIVRCFNWFNSAIFGAGVQPYDQLGEWWWWDQSFTTHEPAFYDAYTVAAYFAQTGYPVPTPYLTSISAPTDLATQNFLAWLARQLGAAMLYVRDQVRLTYPGIPVTVLLYTPQVLSTPILTTVNLPPQIQYPAFSLLQLEDYDWVTSGRWSDHARTWGVQTEFGYPASATTYFTGFVQYQIDGAVFWPRIWTAAYDGFAHGVETWVWARPEVFRDGIVWPVAAAPIPAPSALSPCALTFPSLPGLAWNVVKTPIWQTRIQRAVSGREYRTADWPWPLWAFTLTYEFVRDQAARGYDELHQLAGFFLECQGAATPFCFLDPNDNTVTNGAIGTGDGATLSFQLARNYGGFSVPVVAADPGNIALFWNGAPQIGNWSVDAGSGIAAFTSPPPAGVAITATFTFHFRCRFTLDAAEFEEFLQQLWTVKKLTLLTAPGR
jgi:uncharacterized protein (TIGR02217 family)